MRVQVARRTADLRPNGFGPMYEIPGAVTFGEAYRLDGGRTETHGEIVDSLQMARTHHLISVGVSAHVVRLDSRLADRFHGIYIFPTVADFVPSFEASDWIGLGAPKNTPVDVINKLNKEINAGLADPKLQAGLAELGGVPLGGSPADFGKLIANETEKCGKVIRAANIKAE